MANRKGARKQKDTRPSLEEIKQQTGKNLYCIYEGVERGPMSIPAVRPRFAGDIPQELNIIPWEMTLIGEEWLDDVRFKDLYLRTPGLRVWKTDEYPHKIDLKLPDALERSVSLMRQQTAYMIATNPFTENAREFLQVKNIDAGSEIMAEQWENEQLYPFLECVLFYEQKLMKRPEVVKLIKDRLNDIDASAEQKNRRNRWLRYGQ